jgi:Leucine-rich repeat (LRR) protein
MKNLAKPNVAGTNISTLSEGFGELESLTKLNLSRCYALESLSEGFGELKSLKKLTMYNCPAASSMPAALKEQLKGQGCRLQIWVVSH